MPCQIVQFKAIISSFLHSRLSSTLDLSRTTCSARSVKGGLRDHSHISHRSIFPDTVDRQNAVNRRILANVLYRVEYSPPDPRLPPPGMSEVQEDPELDY